MKLEQQVVSLELAQKLKELGVKQESYFWWYRSVGNMYHLGDNAEAINNAVQTGNSTAWQIEQYSAFTVAELGEMLPKLNGSGWYETHRNGDGLWVCHHKISSLHIGHQATADNEADARAKCLVYLLENKLITL